MSKYSQNNIDNIQIDSYKYKFKKWLNWEILSFYPLNELISNLMPATVF